MRLAGLLRQYGLPATFYIPNCCELSEDQIIELGRDFGIGGHTVSHYQDLKSLSDAMIYCEVMDNKTWLEDLVGRDIDRFCYPRGRYNDRVKDIVKICGFKSARTTIVLRTGSDDPFQTDTTIHVFQRREYGGRSWIEVAKEWAQKASEAGGIFHIWGHSKELDRFSEWERLEEFFKWLINNFEIINL